MIEQWEHLRHVAERMTKFIPELEIGLCRNCPKALEPLKVVPSGDKGPYTMQLRHGWTLTGPLQVKDNSSSGNVTCHRITVRQAVSRGSVLTPSHSADV